MNAFLTNMLYGANIDVQISITVGTVLFLIGLLGALRYCNNLFRILISMELMILGIMLNFLALSSYFHDINLKTFSIFILAMSAVEIVLAITILIVYIKEKRILRIYSEISDR